ncbi:hypothetical protein ACFTZI_18855 [Streptomyces decoyicus]
MPHPAPPLSVRRDRTPIQGPARAALPRRPTRTSTPPWPAETGPGPPSKE